MDADQELFAIFRAEVEEQIEDLCDLLQRDPRRWRVQRLFQISHNVKGAARLVGVDSVRDVAHALEDLFSGIRDETLDVGPVVVELARQGTDLLSASFAAMEGEESPPPVSDFRLAVDQALPNQEINSKGDARPVASPERIEQDDQIEETPPEQSTRQPSAASSTLRVDTEKVETLLGLSSEFVSLVFQAEGQASHARHLSERLPLLVHNHPELSGDPQFRELERMARELGRTLVDHSASALRVSDELQSSVRTLRMVRIEGLRTLLNRSLREACRDTGRDAVLKISGGNTEVDRAVLEQLRDPLVHLLRNAVAHGIEPPDERRTAGKSQKATVELSARSAGSWVEISVADDGRGIDATRVRSRALELKNATQQELETVDDSAALNFLFEPGFSTAEEVSELAGRGVGLDIVKSHLMRLGGEASIESQPGAGTQVLLRVPLTRLTTSGIIIRVGDQLFALST
ncbi:MAG: hypothetical protein GY906_22150, partial [bacterium]|nr:hypothetical protein [bacterium]